MPTVPIRLPGSLTGRRRPVDLGSIHFCAEVCQHITVLERVLLEDLALGLSNKEIGRAMSLAEVTVKNRLSLLYRKFGVRSRLELALAVVATGLVETPKGIR